MNTPKSEVASMLKSLPKDSSFEDVQYHRYVLEKIKRGLERADKEGGIPHKEAKQRLRQVVALVVSDFLSPDYRNAE